MPITGIASQHPITRGCLCGATGAIAGAIGVVVIDPFSGTGTLLLSARRIRRIPVRGYAALVETAQSAACPSGSRRHGDEPGEENSDEAAWDRTGRDDDAPVGHDFAEALRDAMTY
jgi:hypothetical protein